MHVLPAAPNAISVCVLPSLVSHMIISIHTLLWCALIVSDSVCDYLQKSALEFQVWGEAPPPVVTQADKRVRDPDDPDDVLTDEEVKEEKVGCVPSYLLRCCSSLPIYIAHI
jgi:hypothetical protein